MAIRIAPLTHADPVTVEELLDAAFGADRHARTAYRIRAGTTPIGDLSFAAFAGGQLVGTLQCWPVQVGNAAAALVGPVAVAPDRQRGGIGRMLMATLIAVAPDVTMTMIGDPEYYGRWDFDADATSGWAVPGPVERHRLLARNARDLPRHGTLGPRHFAIATASA